MDSLIRAIRTLRSVLDAVIPALEDASEHDEPPADPLASVPRPPPTAPPPTAPPPTALYNGPVHPDVLADKIDPIQVGADKHATLVETWLRNWRVEGAPQPDRQSALVACYAGWLRPWREYVRHRGGLVGATQDAILRYNLATADDSLPLARAVAQEMAAVGSLFSLPVDGFLEASMFVDPHGPLSGGPVADSASMQRPKF